MKRAGVSRVPVHDGVHCRLLMSALGVIGILRTAPCPVFRWLSHVFRTHYLPASAICTRISSQHRFRYHHRLKGCCHHLEWYLQSYRHRMDSWSCCSFYIHTLDGGVEVHRSSARQWLWLSTANDLDVLRYRPSLPLLSRTSLTFRPREKMARSGGLHVLA